MSKEITELEGEIAESTDLVEVYHAVHDIEAGVVMTEILAPLGIDAFRHDRRSRALPMVEGMIGIAVPSSQADQARQALHEARRDNVLLGEGSIIDDNGDEEADQGGVPA